MCILCQQTSPKRWFRNRTMTSFCDVTNSAHQIQMTTLCHWMKTPHEKFLRKPLVIVNNIVSMATQLSQIQNKIFPGKVIVCIFIPESFVLPSVHKCFLQTKTQTSSIQAKLHFFKSSPAQRAYRQGRTQGGGVGVNPPLELDILQKLCYLRKEIKCFRILFAY